MRHALVMAASPGLATVELDGAMVTNVPVSMGATLEVGTIATLLQEGRSIVALAAIPTWNVYTIFLIVFELADRSTTSLPPSSYTDSSGNTWTAVATTGAPGGNLPVRYPNPRVGFGAAAYRCSSLVTAAVPFTPPTFNGSVVHQEGPWDFDPWIITGGAGAYDDGNDGPERYYFDYFAAQGNLAAITLGTWAPPSGITDGSWGARSATYYPEGSSLGPLDGYVFPGNGGFVYWKVYQPGMSVAGQQARYLRPSWYIALGNRTGLATTASVGLSSPTS